MITGVEIDFIVPDSLAALPLYESIFDVERLEVTSLPAGQNEAIFTIYGVRFHMLDENPEFSMVAPKPGDPKPIWFNIAVPDIRATWAKAMAAGCTEIQPVTDMESMGVSNAMFNDALGYIWMLHEIHAIVPVEERVRILTENQ